MKVVPSLQMISVRLHVMLDVMLDVLPIEFDTCFMMTHKLSQAQEVQNCLSRYIAGRNIPAMKK
jgi:hypothetical protein